MMTKTLKAGDRVSWKSQGGKAHGKVVKKLTSETQIQGHKVAASKDNPEYLVETTEGKQAAHKPGSLKKA
jgi:plastocyanin